MKTLKYIVLGNSGSGKSSIINQYMYKSFKRDMESTIGVDMRIKNITLEDQSIKINMWDLAGQDRFRSIVRSYYRNTHGVLLVFDINDIKSFQSLDFWYNELDQVYDINNPEANNPIIYLLGNKNDVKTDNIVITDEMIKDFLESKNIKKYFECTARDTDSINIIFNSLNSEVLKNNSIESKMVTIDIENKDEKRRYCCW